MRKIGLFLCIIISLTLCACGKEEGINNVANTPTPIITNESDNENTIETTETTKATMAPATDSTENISDIWVMEEAPAIRNSFSEEEKISSQIAILEKGTALYSGKTNEGYYPSDISWLNKAGEKDALALIYACDDETHGGWGVLGMVVEAEGGASNQKDITAYSDQPQKERLVVYSMEELLQMANAEKLSDITAFRLGAWNGGRIAGLYYLPEEVASELNTYLAEVEEAERIIHTYNGELSNENAIENARIVYAYLQEVYGKVCLTGQMESTWMGSPDYELNYIENATGKLPAIRGLDFMHNDFAGVTKRTQEWWEKGGIPTICWHTGSDFSSGYDESKAHDLNWEEAFVPGTDTYNKLLEDMDRAVPYLQQLEDAGVPVLWRPFHELDGGWFWWSKGGAENFVKLWQLMYSRYTDFWGLDILIWVLGYSGNGGNMAAWYPGDDYVDLLGADSYNPGANVNLYEECNALAPEGMPVVFHECGTIPTEEQMKEGAPWSFFMVWHTDYITNERNNSKESLDEIYNSEYFITLDELPFNERTTILTETATNAEEVTYMKKYEELILNKPNDTVYNEQPNVEYGEFQKYTYYSQTAERDTNVNILLPPGYSEDKKYPVLYILHGFWDNEEWMARPVVSLSIMLSNLYASGEVEEMIVVLPYIYCSKDMPYCTGMDLTNCFNYDNFIIDLTTDLMPFIENTFSVAKGRENTAITGFSMGGRESLFIGFSHPELFGYIGAVCPAPGLVEIPNSPMHPGQMTKEEMVFGDNKPYLMLISASKADGVVGSSPMDYHNYMTQNEVEHLWHELSDTGHDHSSVKPHLYNFLRLIFKE